MTALKKIIYHFFEKQKYFYCDLLISLTTHEVDDNFLTILVEDF